MTLILVELLAWPAFKFGDVADQVALVPDPVIQQQMISRSCANAPAAGQVNGEAVSVLLLLAGLVSTGETITGPAMTATTPAKSLVLADAATVTVLSEPATVTLE